MQSGWKRKKIMQQKRYHNAIFYWPNIILLWLFNANEPANNFDEGTGDPEK